MKTRQQLIAAYDAGRRNLLIMTILTAINTALALFGSSWSFLFTAFFPYVCANWARYGYWGMSVSMSVLCGCLLPIAGWLACWFLSDKQRYGWLKAAAALFALDTVYMVYFFIAYGFDAAFVLTVLFHALVLWQLIRASVAAKRLTRGDFEEIPEPAAVSVPATAEPETLATVPQSDFRYDRAYAGSTGANKTGKIALTVLAFLAWMLVGVFLSLGLLDMRLELGLEVVLPVMIIAMIRLSAFLEAPAAVYHVDESGVLTRDKADLPPFNHTAFYHLEVAEQRDDCWVVRYEYPVGKPRKAVIPKAYPGLESFMATAGTAAH